MSCSTESQTYGPAPVWTNKTTNWMFFPLTPVMSTVGMKWVRTSLELAQTSGLVTIRAGLRTSNDGASWGAAVEVSDLQQSTNGTAYGSGYEDLGNGTAYPGNTVTSKQFIQFGLLVKNTSGTQVEMAGGTLRLDLKAE